MIDDKTLNELNDLEWEKNELSKSGDIYEEFPSNYKKRIIDIKYAFYKLDKYKRPMFYVESNELTNLYNRCQKLGQKISLMTDNNGVLILILGGSNQHERRIPVLECVMYNGALRFYTPRIIEWSN